MTCKLTQSLLVLLWHDQLRCLGSETCVVLGGDADDAVDVDSSLSQELQQVGVVEANQQDVVLGPIIWFII